MYVNNDEMRAVGWARLRFLGISINSRVETSQQTIHHITDNGDPMTPETFEHRHSCLTGAHEDDMNVRKWAIDGFSLCSRQHTHFTMSTMDTCAPASAREKAKPCQICRRDQGSWADSAMGRALPTGERALGAHRALHIATAQLDATFSP